MTKKLVIGAGIAAVAGTVAIVIALRGDDSPRRPRHHPKTIDTEAVHARAFDRSDASQSYLTMLKAPDAATPCETAYAAIEAEQAAARERGGASIFTWVAPKPDFLAVCRAQSKLVQDCMMPRYRRDHADECEHAKPPDEVLKKLVVGAAVPEPDFEL